MSGQRERINDGGPGPESNASGGIGDNLGNLRQRGEDLLAAGDEAIARGLSRESQKFVRSVRQSSGQ